MCEVVFDKYLKVPRSSGRHILRSRIIGMCMSACENLQQNNAWGGTGSTMRSGHMYSEITSMYSSSRGRRQECHVHARRPVIQILSQVAGNWDRYALLTSPVLVCHDHCPNRPPSLKQIACQSDCSTRIILVTISMYDSRCLKWTSVSVTQNPQSLQNPPTEKFWCMLVRESLWGCRLRNSFVGQKLKPSLVSHWLIDHPVRLFCVIVRYFPCQKGFSSSQVYISIQLNDDFTPSRTCLGLEMPVPARLMTENLKMICLCLKVWSV